MTVAGTRFDTGPSLLLFPDKYREVSVDSTSAPQRVGLLHQQNTPGLSTVAKVTLELELYRCVPNADINREQSRRTSHSQ